MCEGNSIHILKVERKQKKQIRQSYMILLRCKEKQTDFGYTAQETLTELQKLYEENGLHIPEQTANTLQKIWNSLCWKFWIFFQRCFPFVAGNW